MAGPTYGNQNQVQAINIAFEITTAVESELFNVQYPEHDWRKVVAPDQVISNINVGAQNYAYMMRDRRGAAAFQSNIKGNNIPMVGTSLGAVTIPLAASAVGAKLSNEDARQYQFGMNANLSSELGEAMRQALENLIETTTFFGDVGVGFKGFLSYTGVTVGTLANGASGYADWARKTGAEMVADVNAAITYVWNTSNTLFVPNVVYLPPVQWALLNSTPMAVGSGNNSTGLAVTAMQYLKDNNICKALTGKELEILPIRYLTTAGVNGVTRMVLAERSKNNQFMPFPMPYQLQAPVAVPLGAEFYAEMKHGSYAVRQLGSMLYIDGI